MRTKYEGSPTQIVTDITEISLKTVCRRRERRVRRPDTNLTDFFPKPVGQDPNYGPEIHSSRLLLLHELNGKRSWGQALTLSI